MRETVAPQQTSPGRLPAESSITEITPNQATLLAHVLKEIRPTWHIGSLMALFKEHRTIAPFPALAEAAIKVARNPDKKTPAIIFMEGKHWLNDEQAQSTAHTAALGNEPDCEEHVGEPMSTCTQCKPLKRPMPEGFREAAGLSPKAAGK